LRLEQEGQDRHEVSMERVGHQIARIREAKGMLFQAVSTLRRPSPESMAQCGSHLENALLLIREAGQIPAIPGSILEGELRSLAREVRRVRTLLASAAEMYQRWANILALASGGYGAEGQAVPVETEPRFVVEA
jgi:hypothetical protein